MCNSKTELLYCGIAIAWFMLCPVAATAQTVNLDTEIQQLLATITQQQELLGKLSAEIQAQAELLKAVQKQLDDLKQQTTGAQSQAAQALPMAQQATIHSQGNGTTTSTPGRVKYAISGQVNRAVNTVNDGKDTDVYFVDNDISNSRVRLVSTATISDETTLGVRVELALAPDDSRTVSQTSQNSSADFFDQRWADISLENKKYGKLSFGKGDTASNNTAEVDLSRTEIVQNSSIADIASGMLFREKTGTHPVTTIRLLDTFNNRDGLSRQSRLRYDTPSFAGFTLAGSYINNERADAAIFWSGRGYGFKAAAAAAVANPQLVEDSSGRTFGLQKDGSFSVLHGNSGLNLTFSTGTLSVDSQSDIRNQFAKLGWTTTFFDVGATAFGVAYTRSDNLPADKDFGHSASAAAVQFFDKYGAELYFQYRRYSLDRHTGPEVADISVVTIGSRVKF